MQLGEHLYTNEEFRVFENRPENADKNFELINGVIVEMPSGTPLHAWIAFQIGYLIRRFFGTNEIGYVFGDSIDYELAPGLTLKLDTSFISTAKISSLPKQFKIAPDLAVEVLSPSNTQIEMASKIELYIQYGAQLVWVIYPDQKIVRVYSPAGDGRIILQKLIVNDRLDGGAVLPGFNVAVSELFPTIGTEE